MKKLFLSALMGASLCISTLAQHYHLTGQFYIDDFEEPASSLVASATVSNPSIIPTNTLSILGNGHDRKLVFNVAPDSYGDVGVNIVVCDTGYSATHTAMFYASPTNTLTINTNISEFPFFLKTLSYSNRVELQWSTNVFGTIITDIVHPLTFKINRFPSNSWNSTKRFTIGYSSGTNFVDTNVITGTPYWYVVSIKHPSTNLQASVLCTNLPVSFKMIPSVPIQYTPVGFAFYGVQGKTYRISYKSDLTIDTDWLKMEDVNVAENNVFMFSGPQYQNKIIYVTEVQQ